MTRPWTASRVAEILGARSASDITFSGVSTDTRSLESGALFVALVGERFDGHTFLTAAKTAGATGAVVNQGTPPVPGLELIEVDDTLVALGRLATARRREITGPVVAVTGTNGKTTTKEMLARTLGSGLHVHATRSNLNNLIGVPLTILAAPPDTDALVVEAGANEPGEIAKLREIIEPTIGVVTNVAAGHLQGFGGVEGVLAEKTSLLVGVGTAVVGLEPPALATRARTLARRVVTAGLHQHADYHPDRMSTDLEGRVTLTYRGTPVRLPVVGVHQAANAMIALAVADTVGIDATSAVAALATVALPPGRCEVIERGGLLLLNDSYNANPASVRASLATAGAMRGGRPFVPILGTMLELGSESAAAHREIARAVLDIRPTLIGAFGEFVAAFRAEGVAPGTLVTAETVEALGRELKARLRGDELVLLKASRGVGLERVIPYLTEDGEVPCSTTS